MCQFLSSKIQNYGKDERKPSIRRSVFNEVQVVSNVSASIVIGKNEIEKCCKKLERQQRNMAITKYERRNLGNVSVHALAEWYSNKTKIDISLTMIKNISTDVQNDDLDKDRDIWS